MAARRALARCLLVGCALVAACTSAPDARVVDEVPPPVAIPERVERFELGPGTVTVEADVSAGSSYTIRFPRSSGTLVLAPDQREASTVDVLVDATVAESSLQLVADIAREEFLHTSRHPSARFTSRALRRTAEGLDLYGELDFHGTKKSIVVPARIDVEACRVRLACEFTIDRRAFGAVSEGALDPLVSDSVVVRIAADVPRSGPNCPTAPPVPAAPEAPVSGAP